MIRLRQGSGGQARLAEIVAAPPARPEDFELRFSDEELAIIDQSLRVAVWVAKELPASTASELLLVGRLEGLIRKIEARP